MNPDRRVGGGDDDCYAILTPPIRQLPIAIVLTLSIVVGDTTIPLTSITRSPAMTNGMSLDGCFELELYLLKNIDIKLKVFQN